MKHLVLTSLVLTSLLAVGACGGKKPEPVEPKEPEPEPAAEVAAPEPEPEPPPPPRSWRAQAEMTAAKGAKLKGTTVTFVQTEGSPVTVTSTGWFDGIKSGKYHLVVHEAAACGPNGTKAGKAGGGDIEFVAAKGMETLDIGEVNAIQLDGDGTIVGRTLVLHDDKKGKPGKILACGAISAVEDGEADEEGEEDGEGEKEEKE
jgi:hypothetical protein